MYSAPAIALGSILILGTLSLVVFSVGVHGPSWGFVLVLLVFFWLYPAATLLRWFERGLFRRAMAFLWVLGGAIIMASVWLRPAGNQNSLMSILPWITLWLGAGTGLHLGVLTSGVSGIHPYDLSGAVYKAPILSRLQVMVLLGYADAMFFYAGLFLWGPLGPRGSIAAGLVLCIPAWMVLAALFSADPNGSLSNAPRWRRILPLWKFSLFPLLVANEARSGAISTGSAVILLFLYGFGVTAMPYSSGGRVPH